MVGRLGSSREGEMQCFRDASSDRTNFTILPAHAIKPAPTHINSFCRESSSADADGYSNITFLSSVSTFISL